jgi:predicted TIM-barrel fold metal-dependent hydrolase
MRKLIRWTYRFSPRHPVPEDVTLEALLEEYARAGVDRLWNFAHALRADETDALNAWSHALGRRDPRVVPFGTCHPEVDDPQAVVDRCFLDYGFPGLKFHPFVQRFVPWEPRFFPVWERMARHRGIAVFHTGFEAFYGAPLPLAGFALVLETFPELTVVLAHAGYPRVREAFDLVGRHPNLFLDTVHVFGRVTAEWDPGSQADAWAALREGLRAFPGRVMFGTDHPAGTGTLAGMYGEARAFGLPPEAERRLLGGTAAALLASRVGGGVAA